MTARRVADVEFADEVEMKFEAGDFKFGRGRAITNVEGVNGVIAGEAKFFHGTMRDVHQRGKIRVVAVAEEQAVARDQADEVREGFLMALRSSKISA